MRFFLAGIMQGSHLGTAMHNQSYRTHLKNLLLAYIPGAEVYDPLADHAGSVDYHDDLGRSVFMHHNRMCGEVDVVVAVVPEATMGTAIEMWEAHRHGKTVVTISPLRHNWAVKFLSDLLFKDVEEFEAELISGRLAKRISEMVG